MTNAGIVRRRRQRWGVEAVRTRRSLDGSLRQRAGGLRDQVAEEAKDVGEKASAAVDNGGAGLNGVGAEGQAGEESRDGTHVVILSSWAARGCAAPCAVESLRSWRFTNNP